ncbi:MAG TPA: HAD family acid phosphatase [Gaiellaceae bacterium]|jgi:hypothetical protein|nr:HAD family acid phosphatase [Gaiellaceae bacterium]
METRTRKLLRHTRPVRAAVIAAAAVAATLALTLAATAIALAPGGPPVPAPPANPTSADQIQNIDQVKTAIKAYYGDTLTNVPDPVDGSTMLHTFSPTSSYANEMAGLESGAEAYLAHDAKPGPPGPPAWHGSHDHSDRHNHSGRHNPHNPPSNPAHATGMKAILLDIDDTTLNTYNYEIYSNFVYNPTTNADFVNAAAFPAVPGMPALVNEAKTEGYTIFFLTGRPEAQRPGTVTNLANAGYPAVPSSQLFLKDQTNQAWLSSCSPNCTTTQYKSLTRQHIESEGYDIVANFGDQFSDLNGGFADRAFKLPNPMYFLP